MSSLHGLDPLEEGISSISTASDLHTALTSLVRLAAEGAHARSASFFRLDDSGTTLKPFVCYGLPEAYIRGCGDVLVGTQCCGRAVQHRRPWVVSDMLTDPLFADARKAAEDSPIRSAFSVPVIDASDRCLGSLACHFPHPHTPSSYDVERSRVFATLIAFAVAKYEGHAEQTFPAPAVEEFERTGVGLSTAGHGLLAPQVR